MSHVDVLIAGGGPAGCAAAVILAKAGLSVHIAHAHRSGHSWAGESLPPGADALIASIFGSDMLLDAPHVAAFGVRGAWGSADLVDTDFISHPHGAGWHLDRACFDTQLRARATEAGAEVVTDQPLQGLVRTPAGWQVEFEDSVVDARWIIDASGRAGALAGRLGVPRTRLDQQVAEIAVVGNASEEAVTTIEATASGWWYSTPVPDGRRVVAFLTDFDLRDEPAGQGMPFEDRLACTSHIRALVDLVKVPAAARTFPADVSYRARLSGNGWSAVGDSAITWDPLSSQGVLTSVLMGARLGAAIADRLRQHSSEPMAAWESDYRHLLAEHLRMRSYYAAAEHRWPESPFWLRRSTQPAMPSL